MALYRRGYSIQNIGTFLFEYNKSVAKGLNALYRKKMQWVIDCFNHFFELFPQIDKQVKSEMISIEKCIEEKYQQMENEIDDILKKVEN